MQALVRLWDETVGKWILYARVQLPGPHGGSDETVLAVPGYYQAQSYTCAFTAGLMVLHTFHPRRSAERFLHAVAPEPPDGTPRARLVRALRGHRIGVGRIRQHTFGAVAKRIERGEPIVAMVKARTHYHWVVLYGVERGRSPHVYVAANGLPWDPVRYRWADFKRIWVKDESFSCWGL